jgi:hypothetical protein
MTEELSDLLNTISRDIYPVRLIELLQAKVDVFLFILFESNFSKSLSDEVCSLSFGHFRQRIETDIVTPLSVKVWWYSQNWVVLRLCHYALW